MKTYTKQTQAPRLVIKYDTDMESPREWDNLGYFITKEKSRYSPDTHAEFLEAIEEAESEAQDTQSHIEAIKRIAIENEIDEKILAIYPVYKYEHGGISYHLGTANGFDYSNCGFYIVTDKTAKNIGTKPKDFERVIKDELEVYNKWLNGEIYRFELYDNKGEIEDSCGGFYELEAIQQNLPEEWKDEKLSDYLIN